MRILSPPPPIFSAFILMKKKNYGCHTWLGD
jgi:hypothetical protein